MSAHEAAAAAARAALASLHRRRAENAGAAISEATRQATERRLLGEIAAARARLREAEIASRAAAQRRSVPREFLRRLRILRAPGARLLDARSYETAVRRGALAPMLREVGEAVLVAADAYHVLRDLFRDTLSGAGARFSAAAEPVVRAQLASQLAAHRARFERAMQRGFGVDVRPLIRQAEVRPLLRAAIAENVRLIKTIPPRYHDALLADLDRLARARPFDRAAVRQVLATGYRSAGYNLRRLTRDQTSKFAGQLNEFRQQSLGITRYQWRTALDERVRPLHQGNEGQIFRWDDPPAGTGHPGWDIQCRCTGDAVIEAAAPRPGV